MFSILLQIYQTGTEQFNLKPLKGISYLQEHELLSSPLDPKEVVKFIKENPKLDKKQIGEFISNKKYSTVLEEYQKYMLLWLYCLVNRGTCVWTTCPELLHGAECLGLEPLSCKSDALTTTPPHHTV